MILWPGYLEHRVQDQGEGGQLKDSEHLWVTEGGSGVDARGEQAARMSAPTKSSHQNLGEYFYNVQMG